MLYNSPLNFFFLSKYTFIRFVTSHSGGSLVSWSRGAGGGKDKGKIPLGKRVPLDKKVVF